MDLKKSLVTVCLMAILGYGADAVSSNNTAIVDAIKANPGLLDSAQAKKYMETKTPSGVVESSQATQVSPTNLVEADQAKESDTPKEADKSDIQNVNSLHVNSLTRSPLSIEKNDDYLNRLMAHQIKESRSALKRYGIEFFSNKNGLDLASLPVPDNYKMVPKDVVSVILFGPKSDNISLTVDKDGNIVIPSFGPLHIAGLSFIDAKKTITDALMAAFPNVGVTVNISQFSSIQVTLAGEVATPGIYNVSSFSTVKEALIAAGGLSKNGSMRSVMIKRNGRVYRTIDLYTIIRGTGRSDSMLQAGDVIVVPVMGKNVVIDGDVKRPAIYEAKSNTTIADLITLAGGLSAEASKNDIGITRYDSHQGMKVLNVSLAEAAKIIAMDQDNVYIYGLDKSNLNGITVYGNVVKPGFWPLSKDGMSLQNFFKRQIDQNTLRGVFLENTYFDYAIIKRVKSNLKEEVIGFSLEKALKGEEKITLSSRDQLYILNRNSVAPVPIVKISGECIARPGEYKFFDKMTFQALLNTAGMTCPIDMEKITIVSSDPVTMFPIVKVVNATQKEAIALQAFDDVRILGFYTTNPIKEAKINGEVYKPGSYPIAANTTLKDVVLSAGGLTVYAYLDRAHISRTLSVDGNKYITQEYFVGLQDLDKDAASFILKDKDIVTIYNIDELNTRASVTINGEVHKPGSFHINEKVTTLKDIILAAGNLTDKASQDKIEIIRYEIVNGIRIRKVETISPAHAMSNSSPLLANYDEITVFKIPKWNERRSVKLVGKVKYPGEYAIEEGEKLSSILARAGGFTDSAYINAAVFTREEIKTRQREGVERQIKELEQRALHLAVQPTEAGQTGSDKGQLMTIIGALKEDAKKIEFPGRLSIRLENDLRRFKGSESDITLKDGDVLYIPEREDSVLVQGEVLNPNSIFYRSSYALEDYIEKSGGLKETAEVKNIFVVHANGEAETFKTGYLFTAQTHIGPGDVIVVPMQISTVSGLQFAKDITSILYQMAVSVAALSTIGAL